MKHILVLIICLGLHPYVFPQTSERTLITPEKTYKADTDTAFSKNSGIQIDNYSPQTIDNLELLCRVWGFLKYYHPAIAAGGYNWDAELFRIMPSILKARTSNARNKILAEWIDQPGKITNFVDYEKEEEREVKMLPDLAWMEDTNRLGKILVGQLKCIKHAKRTEKHYYVNFPRSNPSFTNEREYPQFIFDDDGFRLLVLFRYWNIIQYYFPYRHLTDKDWHLVLGEYIPKFIEARSESDYKLVLVKLITEINDSHAFIDNTIIEKIWGVYDAPYIVKFIEEKPIIVHELGNVIDWGLRKGDIIIGINGQPIEKIIEKRLPYIPASNYSGKLLGLSNILFRTDSTQLEVQVIRDGKNIATKIYTSKNWTRERYVFFNRLNNSRLLTSDIGYIFLGTLSVNELRMLMETFKHTKGIIIDLRCYPIDYDVLDILGEYLIPNPVDFATFTISSTLYPGQFAFIPHPIKAGKENPNYYKGKIVIIVNENTLSHAEFSVMLYQKAPHALVIGGTTAGADGDISRISLPGNIMTTITGLGVYYPDKRETQRAGIIINEVVKPTIKRVIEGRDEFLERSVEIIENSSINMFMLPLFLVVIYRRQRLRC